MCSYTLDEARELNRRYRKKSVTTFTVCVLAICAVLTALLCFTEIFAKFPSLYAVFVILFAAAVFYSKIYLLFRPFEFKGKVTYCKVHVDMVKNMPSHLPGDTYKTHDVGMIDLTVENEKRRGVSRDLRYTHKFGEIHEGTEVILMAFLDIPIIL